MSLDADLKVALGNFDLDASLTFGPDETVVLPIHKNIRIQITSEDVIHSWTIPSFGIKHDAVPGRINESWFNIEKPGIYYGQCSELCGRDHAFMPIEVHVVSADKFKEWVAAAANDIDAAHKLLTSDGPNEQASVKVAGK